MRAEARGCSDAARETSPGDPAMKRAETMKRAAFALAAPALSLAFALAGCGPEQPGAATPAGSAAAPVAKAQQVKNLWYFDLSTLAPSPPAVAGSVTTEVLLGVELSARPAAMECLVDPKNRGPEKKTHVVVDATLTDAGVDHKVTGENLTPSGVACIEAALRAWTQAVPALTAKNAVAPGGGPVKSHLELEHVVGSSPAVELGVNDASDVAGAIRLALPGWGDCFAEWKSAPPRALKASVKVVRAATPTVTPAEVTFEPSADPGAGNVAACLTGKIKALALKPPQSDSVALPYTFHFVHSGVTEALPDAPPEVQFIQIDLQRARRTAEASIADGERMIAASVYDDAVKRFKAKAKPEVSVAELKEKCATLLKADDRVIAAVGRLAATETAAQGFTSAQKAKDPTWADAEAKAAQSLAAAQKTAQSYRETRKVDEGACPKLTF